MPLYSFRCTECQVEVDKILSIDDIDTSQLCQCGKVMGRLMTFPTLTVIKRDGRTRIMDTLNYEHGKGLRSKRSTDALASGIDRVKPAMGIGFKPEV